MRVETKTEIQIREVDVNTYIANDGKEFDNVIACELYETDAKRQELKQKLDQIQTCKELDGCSPVDGGEYYEQHDYRWYLPKTQDEADVLCEYYNLEYGISPDEVGEWVCIEAYDLDDSTEGTYVMPIKDSIKQVQKLFAALGYDVVISKHD